MARVIDYTGDPSPFKFDADNWRDDLVRSGKEMERLESESTAAYKANKAIGLLYQHPHADGYAYYRVVKSSPLTLETIPYMDSWQLPEAHTRGLRLSDIRENVRRRLALAELFSRKQA